MKITKEWYDATKKSIEEGDALLSQTCFDTQLSPAFLAQSMSKLTKQGLRVPHIVLGGHAWTTILTNKEFTWAMDPVSNVRDLAEGQLAIMYGMTIWSDYNFPSDNKFLNPSEIILCGDLGTVFKYAHIQIE